VTHVKRSESLIRMSAAWFATRNGRHNPESRRIKRLMEVRTV
jgi:hypothetical protein